MASLITIPLREFTGEGGVIVFAIGFIAAALRQEFHSFFFPLDLVSLFKKLSQRQFSFYMVLLPTASS